MSGHGWMRRVRLVALFLALMATPVLADTPGPLTPIPIVGQQGSVTRVAFSPLDGRWLAVADARAITLWNVASGHLVATFGGHDKGIADVAFSPDGSYLASCDGEGIVRLWELATSQLVRSFDADYAHDFGSENSLAFSPDGKLLAVGYTLWDAGSGNRVRELELDEHVPPRVKMRSSDAEFSPDGRVIAIATGLWQVGMWDTESGRLIRKITVTPAGSEVISVAFSPDGSLLATGGTDGLTQVWETATGTLRRAMKRHRGTVAGVAFSPDGKRIASADHDWKIMIRDVSTGDDIRTVSGHKAPVYAVAISPDGRYLASGGYDQTFHVWDFETGTAAPQFEKDIDTINQIAFSPDGQWFASGGLDGSVRIWNRKTAQMRQRLTGNAKAIEAIAFSADGRRLVAGGADGTLWLWEQNAAEQWRPAQTGEIIAGSDELRAVAFLAAGQQIVSGGSGGTVRIHEASSGTLIRSFDAHDLGISSLAVSAEGIIATSGEERIVKLWQAETGQLVKTLEGHEGVVPAVAFSPDGALLASGSEDGTVRFWDSRSGQLLRKIERQGIGNDVYAVAFSHDGKLVAAGGEDGRVTFWDAASGTFAGSIEQVGARVRGLVFSRDDSLIATATSSEYRNTHAPVARPGRSDATLKLWQVPQGTLGSLAAHADRINALGVTGDGTMIASAGEDRSVKVWDPLGGELRALFDQPFRPLKALAVAGNGRNLAASGDDGIRLWDLQSGEEKYLIYQGSSQVNALALSADGSTLAIAGYGFMALSDTATGQITQRWPEEAMSLAFTPDGRSLAIFDKQKRVRIRDVATGRDVRTLARDVAAMSLSADGRTLAAAVSSDKGGKTLELYDFESGRLIRSQDLSDSTSLSSGGVKLALSHDGRFVAAATFNVTRIWESATGHLLHTLARHDNMQLGDNPTLAFLAGTDGKTRFLASAGGDGNIRISPLERETPLVTFFAGKIAGRDEWLAMTQEGFFDASAKGAEMLAVVRGLEFFSIEQFYQSLYRPDLVREKLAGDPDGTVNEAATKLDLAKLLESGLAPKIVITSHQPQDSSAADLVTVEARLTDLGGGIGRAEWRINGVTVGVVQKAAGARGQPVILKQAIALDPGENTIELTAYNGADLISAVPAPVKISWTGKEPSVPPRLFVMVVGINQYLDGALKLSYAVPDATALASALEKAGQNHYQEVIVTRVLDQDATAAKLDAVFADLATKVRPRDVFVFFAAGHGKTHDARYYFIPHDMRYHTEQSLVRDAIGQDRLQDWFARIPAKKAVLMFDTCEAGSLAERTVVASRGLEQKAALGRLIQATGRATLTASAATQQAYEGHGGHGVFTFALLDALGRGDTNNNGLVELTELIQHVDGLVPAITEKRWGAKQYPQMDAFGSNFSLARQIAALAPSQGETVIIPVKPTHVNTELLPIFKEAGGAGEVVEQLPPLTAITLVKSSQGWALIARGGTALGYAAEAKLHKLN